MKRMASEGNQRGNAYPTTTAAVAGTLLPPYLNLTIFFPFVNISIVFHKGHVNILISLCSDEFDGHPLSCRSAITTLSHYDEEIRKLLKHCAFSLCPLLQGKEALRWQLRKLNLPPEEWAEDVRNVNAQLVEALEQLRAREMELDEHEELIAR